MDEEVAKGLLLLLSGKPRIEVVKYLQSQRRGASYHPYEKGAEEEGRWKLPASGRKADERKSVLRECLLVYDMEAAPGLYQGPRRMLKVPKRERLNAPRIRIRAL